MQKKILRKTFLLFLLGGIVFACIYEDDSAQINEKDLIAEAQKWYAENKDDPGKVQFGKEEDEVLIKPDWKHPIVDENGEYATVELVIASRQCFGIIDLECLRKFEETKNRSYLEARNTLVIRKNLKTNRIDGFIMVITPSLEYLESVDFVPFRHNTYLKRDKNLNGYVNYYDLNGNFVNGWQYVDGMAFEARIEKVDPEKPQLRSTCVTYVAYTYTETIANSYYEDISGTMTVVIMPPTIITRYVYSTYCYGDNGGGGSGNGSGGYAGGNDNTTPSGNTETVPKAKKIFRNSNMTEDNWEKLEKMIEKIMEHCLGRALYNSIVSELNGGTVTIQFNNTDGSSFDVANGGISLSMNMQSNQLFHELWHLNQAYQETQSTYNGSRLNQEFESWYAQYLYVSSLPEYKSGSDWYGWFNDSDIGKSVRDLERFIDAKGNLLQGEFATYSYLDNAMVPAFRQSGYPALQYPYDDIRTVYSGFKNLRSLSFNCE
ncbi:hypothetical protein FACS1894145_4650 [Bacteroidia bacterium]|nr:hypothetical protein FACS1894145_4650 [Bacteroidia bacterium]